MSKRLVAVLVPVLLVSCAKSRDLHDASSSQQACTSCHGDPSRPGYPLNQAAPPASPNGGSGGAHLAHLDAGVACGSCHVVPASPNHSNQVVDVTFSGLAVAKGATPAYSGGLNGTCSGVYCHGATLAAGGNVAQPSWTGGALGCDACHGNPPTNHAASSTTCSACHSGTVNADGSINVAGGLHGNGVVDAAGAGGHPTGWADPAQHGASAKTALASCRACHGQNLDGVGGTGPSCETCHAGAGYASWQSNCTFCHGTKSKTYAATAANLLQAAPPRGAQGETLTTDRAVGAHQKHLAGGSLGPAVACAECHAVPTDLGHLDASAAVTFGPAAKRGGASPQWNGASCASVYCHGGTLAGGSNTTPTWTAGNGETSCGSCHGVPPPAPHTTSAACGGCHTGYTSTAVNAALHLNGTIDAAGGNHPANWASKDQHGYAANREGLADCRTCHGTNLDGVGGSAQSCTACHSNSGFADWATNCTFCHGTAGGSAAPPADTQGLSLATNTSVGLHARHVGTTLMAAPACTACHPARSSSVITDAAHIDGDGIAEVTITGGGTYTRSSATSGTCSSVWCHGGTGSDSWTATAATACTSCHAFGANGWPTTGEHTKHGPSGEKRACSDCHGAGYGTSAVVQATHINGTKEVSSGLGFTRTSSTSASCATPGCHGKKSW